MSYSIDEHDEWLETDGLGGYASGTVTGVRTRRYHALLLPATTPPTGRCVLVNGIEAWIRRGDSTFALTTQRYGGEIEYPDGFERLVEFDPDPWPAWRYRLEDGSEIEFALFVRHGRGVTALSWRLLAGPLIQPDEWPVELIVRPLLSGRGIHSTHHENAAFRFVADIADGRVSWRPYVDRPRIDAVHNGEYIHEPVWYGNFLYSEERARGLDFLEDLASPGVLAFDLRTGPAVLLLAAASPTVADPFDVPAETWLNRERAAEKRRRSRFETRLHRAADAYVVKRDEGKTIIAGYPWFSDWGRDTFIALRGLCIAGGRLDDAKQILLRWAGEVSEGMLPNLFAEQGDQPAYNSVDAALWYVIAVDDFLEAVGTNRRKCLVRERNRLHAAVLQILEGYRRGTRHGIRADDDGLLAAGEPGLQLTWMDAKIDDHVVTPRIGKPVEVNALWLNALAIGARLDDSWNTSFDRGRAAFEERYWNAATNCLYDVIDVDHRRGALDAAIRPNQIFAVGGLPLSLVEGERARRIVDIVEEKLLTPLGSRSLAEHEPGYRGHYEGGVIERDNAYHQGTAWPWLAGAFVDAWLRVRRDSTAARAEARDRFLQPLLDHLDVAGLGHVSEIADGSEPFTPRGCPFQAWSLGELIRLQARLQA
jgi:predicted glycogen debranching enzyme